MRRIFSTECFIFLNWMQADAKRSLSDGGGGGGRRGLWHLFFCFVPSSKQLCYIKKIQRSWVFHPPPPSHAPLYAPVWRYYHLFCGNSSTSLVYQYKQEVSSGRCEREREPPPPPPCHDVLYIREVEESVWFQVWWFQVWWYRGWSKPLTSTLAYYPFLKPYIWFVSKTMEL